MVVSSAKDMRTVVTNFKTGEQILEFPSTQSFKKICWSIPGKGKIAAMDTEGNASILSVLPVGLYSKPNTPFASPQIAPSTGSAYAPKWLEPRCVARFGFGNRLVTFNSKNRQISIH
jgi:hypothetical protein